MLDADLAELYGVTTGRLNEQVKRNRERFPKDFMFQLTKREYEILLSQNAMSSWGGRRHPPYAFTEQGVAMLSSVLRSPQAARVNIEIMRAFVRLRKMLRSNEGLSRKLDTAAIGVAALQYFSNDRAVFCRARTPIRAAT